MPAGHRGRVQREDIEMATLSPEQRKEQIWSVIRVSSGNFLEMYDFFVFGYYASASGRKTVFSLALTSIITVAAPV